MTVNRELFTAQETKMQLLFHWKKSSAMIDIIRKGDEEIKSGDSIIDIEYLWK